MFTSLLKVRIIFEWVFVHLAVNGGIKWCFYRFLNHPYSVEPLSDQWVTALILVRLLLY